MSDFDPTLDEIVSAYVDGEATAAERAQVEADPALLERVATFRRLQDAVATTSQPASAEAQRALVARALRDTAPPVATVQSIRSRRVAAAARPLAIAAAVIAALIGFGALVANTDDDSGDSASTAASATTRASAFAEAGAADNAAQAAPVPSAAGGTTLAAVSAPPFLGVFADEAAVRQSLSHLEAKATAPQADASGRSSTTPPCAEVTSATAAGATIYRAELRTRLVTIAVTGTRAEVIDDLTCTRTVLDLASR
jgi:hypothetical protein